jgi:hypothetical protein
MTISAAWRRLRRNPTMSPNPILEGVWWIKEELAREADYDLHRMCERESCRDSWFFQQVRRQPGLRKGVVRIRV